MEYVKVYCEGRTELLYICETKFSLKRKRADMFAASFFLRLNACLNFHNSWFSRRISKIIALIFTVRKFAILFPYLLTCRPGSTVGIATGYGLYGPRIESR